MNDNQSPQKYVHIAYIWLFFLGIFGAHRFYLRRPGTAILWLLTGGLFGVGVLVDVFRLNTLTIATNVKLWNEYHRNVEGYRVDPGGAGIAWVDKAASDV